MLARAESDGDEKRQGGNDPDQPPDGMKVENKAQKHAGGDGEREFGENKKRGTLSRVIAEGEESVNGCGAILQRVPERAQAEAVEP